MEKIFQGAEAILYRTERGILKRRIKKGYRTAELDDQIRKFRTRREAKVLKRLEENNFPAPRLIDFSDKYMEILMTEIKGEKLSDCDGSKILLFMKEAGERIAELHSLGIIHGDITASNMIIDKKIYFIDFGLSFFSEKIEDQAVDLHLLDRALESRHYNICPKAFDYVLEGYKSFVRSDEVLERIKIVSLRGRNKR